MNRRNFLGNLCKTGAALLVAGTTVDLLNVKTIHATSRATADPEVREIPINLIDNPDLKPVGGTYHLELDDLQRDILVVHTADNQFYATDIKCTHRGCDVQYDPDSKELVCPCHDSHFDVTGRVLTGPATKPLNYYHAELKGDEVMVTVYTPGEAIPANCVRPSLAAPATDSTMARDSTMSRDSTGHNADTTKSKNPFENSSPF